MTRAKQTAGGHTRRNRERNAVMSKLLVVLSIIALVRQEEN